MAELSPLRYTLVKDLDKTVEHCIQMAKTQGRSIQLWDRKLLLTVNKFGDIEEPKAAGFRVPMQDLIADSAISKGPKALAVAMRFAQAFEK